MKEIISAFVIAFIIVFLFIAIMGGVSLIVNYRDNQQQARYIKCLEVSPQDVCGMIHYGNELKKMYE